MEPFYIDVYKRVWGNKDIQGDQVVTTNNNTLTIVDSNGNSIALTLPEATYNTTYAFNQSELVKVLEDQIIANSLPVKVSLGSIYKGEKNNCIVLEMTDGSTITDLSGTFYEAFFK